MHDIRKVDQPVKRRIAGLLAACLLIGGTVAWADNTFEGLPIVRVILNQQEVTNDVPAVLLGGRTMLPLRKIAELSGLTIDRWDGDTNTVYLGGGAAAPVATVNGEPITQSALYNRMMMEGGAHYVDIMISELLVDQAARQAGITIHAAEIDREIERVRVRIGGEAQLQEALRAANMTMEQLRSAQAHRLKVTKLLAPRIDISDSVLRAYFERNRTQFDNRRVHARHILVATEAEAKAVKAELDKGADFAAVAKAESTEPAAQYSGGDLGTFGPGQMVPEFEQVVFTLPVGAISDPFQTAFGWHVAQVLERTGSAPDFALIKDDVRAAYLEMAVQDQAPSLLAELRAKANITTTVKQK
ncbi:MAG: hypothetical protein K0R39_2128 [Symbiobacteriaceae bacterium]|jgi:foldase protein PrsA|nr:hypothetical protein [Symbiobacteriaceae bacterium]